MKRFGLLGMVSRAGPQNDLNKLAVFLLHNQVSTSLFFKLRDLSAMYTLPDPLQILLFPPPKNVFKNLVRKRILDYWHKKLVQDSKTKSSLCFLQAEFLPLGAGPHPPWLSCESSPTANRAAIIMAHIISGRYRDDYLSSRWDGGSNCCRLPNCGFFPGDCSHYLSGSCPALKDALLATLQHSLDSLSETPYLISPLISAWQQSSDDWSKFITDPSCNPQVIKIKKDLGPKSIWPLFKVSRAYIWTMHELRLKHQES